MVGNSWAFVLLRWWPLVVVGGVHGRVAKYEEDKGITA
jgi:hypothetical protein